MTLVLFFVAPASQECLELAFSRSYDVPLVLNVEEFLRHSQMHFLAAVVMLVLVVFGAIVDGGNWVLCTESSGRVALEASHLPGVCEAGGYSSSTIAIAEKCSDRPLLTITAPESRNESQQLLPRIMPLSAVLEAVLAISPAIVPVEAPVGVGSPPMPRPSCTSTIILLV